MDTFNIRLSEVFASACALECNRKGNFKRFLGDIEYLRVYGQICKNGVWRARHNKINRILKGEDIVRHTVCHNRVRTVWFFKLKR